MPIFYGLVVREAKTVMWEYTDYGGNFQQITRQLFPYIDKNKKKSFQTNEYFFHCIDDEGISFLWMADEKTDRKVAYAFLEEMKKAFYNTFNTLEIQNARSYELKFSDQIKQKMEFFNENGFALDNKSEEVLRQLQDVKNVMITNMEKLLERDFKIEVCLAKSRDLNQYSLTYKKRAKSYNRMQRNRRIWYIIGGILILAIVIFVIILISCGGLSW